MAVRHQERYRRRLHQQFYISCFTARVVPVCQSGIPVKPYFTSVAKGDRNISLVCPEAITILSPEVSEFLTKRNPAPNPIIRITAAAILRNIDLLFLSPIWCVQKSVSHHLSLNGLFPGIINVYIPNLPAILLQSCLYICLYSFIYSANAFLNSLSAFPILASTVLPRQIISLLFQYT